jgi:hypothetical protein
MSTTHNLLDELIGFVYYLEGHQEWSTDEAKAWSDRCTAWIKTQIQLNETTLKNTNHTETDNNQ